MDRKWLWVILGLVGVVIVVAHLIALAFLGMALGSWVSGTVIGLAIVLVAGAHFVVPLHSGASGKTQPRQVALWALALGLGILEGYLAGSFLMGLGWWLLAPWALTVLGLGMLPGTQKDKSVRLLLFGFASVVLLTTTAFSSATVGEVAMDLALALAGALGALAIGAAAHLTRASLHPPQKT
jgi:hypothetical protein